MKTNIIVSTLSTLALLLGGCDGSNGTDENPVVVLPVVVPDPVNHAPTASTLSFPSTEEGATVSFSIAGTFSDPDGDTLTFDAEGLPDGLSLDSDTGTITGTVLDDANQMAPYTVSVSADDGRGESVSASSAWNIAASFKDAGWYGKTSVKATAADAKVYQHNTAGVFGELKQSSDEEDQHDIAGYGPALLQVILLPEFTTDVPTDTGYFSEYKKYSEESSEKKTWTFQIKNQHTVNLASSPIIISLDGVYDVQYKEENGKVSYKESSEANQTILSELHLVDVDNQVEYTVEELTSANLTMEGLHTRTFRWVHGTTDGSDYAPLATMSTASASMSTFSVEDASSTFTSKTTQSTGGKFGLPPQ